MVFARKAASGAEIASTTAGTGSGGSVTVDVTGALVISGNGVADTQIATSATGLQSGTAGSVNVQAGSLTIETGGQIASSSAGLGRGGDVSIAITSDAVLTGAGTQVTARSTGSGDAGSITLSATNLNMSEGAAISTEATTANGGNITLKVGYFMQLVDSEITTSVHGAIGNGGNILIDPQFLILERSRIVAQAVEGHGGNITIVADQYLPSADSVVSASSQLGVSGAIEIVGPRVDLNGSLVVLPSELRDAVEVLRNSCAARSGLPRSSLTGAGRGGLPQDPEASVPALYLADRDASPARFGDVAPGRHATPTQVSQLRLSMPCH
jgi:large exoprotein involved in heme utilization and adhesion